MKKNLKMKTKIYSIVYDKNQIVEYEKYDNSHIKTMEQKSYFFEYNVLIDVINNHNTTEDYLGIFSYKFPMKTGLFKKKLFKILEQNPNYDIYSFCSHKVNLKGKYLQFTEKVHPGFLNLFTKLCNDLELEVKEPKYIVYSNFFVCKTEIYREYVNEIIKPAIELLETKYKQEVWQDSNYKGLEKDKLKQYTGLDYYPFHTFLLERLFSIWIENKNYKIYEH